MTINAQVWLDSLSLDKKRAETIRAKGKGSLNLKEDLKGNLIIEGFSKLKTLDLNEVFGLDKLIIRDCPNLEDVEIQNSGVKELEIGKGVERLSFLDFSFEIDSTHTIPRKLAKLDLRNVPNLKSLACFGVHDTEFEGIEELTKLRNFNGGDSSSTEGPLIPNSKFLLWRDTIKKILGVDSNKSLPDSWENELTNKLDGSDLSKAPSGQTLKSLISNFSSDKGNLKKELDRANKELGESKMRLSELELNLLKHMAKELELDLEKGNINKNQVLGKIRSRIKKVCADYNKVKNENVDLEKRKKDLFEKGQQKDKKITELNKRNDFYLISLTGTSIISILLSLNKFIFKRK